MSDEWKCAEMEYMERDGVEVQDWLDISGAEIYSAGKLVTYHVDANVVYQAQPARNDSGQAAPVCVCEKRREDAVIVMKEGIT